jgi:hypothetical protein
LTSYITDVTNFIFNILYFIFYIFYKLLKIHLVKINKVMSFIATSGYYVVNSEDTWVYDVDIYLDNSSDKKAVVGFSPKQTVGALFWQCDIDEVIKERYDCDLIVSVAREYRDKNRPKALCE